jgi:hypothetical protein
MPIEEWRSRDSCADSKCTSEGTWYLVLRTLYNEMKSCYLILVTWYSFNADRRMKKWGFVCWLKWHFWRYFVPCTWYFVLCSLVSRFLSLASFLIPNAERRSKNEEVGIWVLTQMVLLKVLCTWYFVLRTTLNHLLSPYIFLFPE